MCWGAYTFKRASEPTGGGGGGHSDSDTLTTTKAVAIDVPAADDAVLSLPPLALAAIDVSYSVPSKHAPLTLLSHVTASFEPGTLTALMGASGAGKTTLLDVLAGRKTAGEVAGAIYVGGARVDTGTLPRVSAYVEQTDAHYPLTTVREAVEFAAALRLPRGASAGVRATAVDAALATAGLTAHAHAIVGPAAGGRGLPPDARKRLTLAVELATAPSIILQMNPHQAWTASRPPRSRARCARPPTQAAPSSAPSTNPPPTCLPSLTRCCCWPAAGGWPTVARWAGAARHT